MQQMGGAGIGGGRTGNNVANLDVSWYNYRCFLNKREGVPGNDDLSILSVPRRAQHIIHGSFIFRSQLFSVMYL